MELEEPKDDSMACIHRSLVFNSSPSLLSNISNNLFLWQIASSPYVVFTSTSTSPVVYAMKGNFSICYCQMKYQGYRKITVFIYKYLIFY